MEIDVGKAAEQEPGENLRIRKEKCFEEETVPNAVHNIIQDTCMHVTPQEKE